MSSKPSTAEFIVDQLAAGGVDVEARKMFGEYGVFHVGKMIAVICDDQFFVKPTAAGRAFAKDCPDGVPYPNAKPHIQIPGERWDNADWLAKLIQITVGEFASAAVKPKKSVPKERRRAGKGQTTRL
jgi:DNA transformation protein and related proteins